MCGNEHCFSVLLLGILVSGDGIDRMLSKTAYHLHLCFQFSYQTISRFDSCTLSAPNRVAATKMCGNECFFRFCVWAFVRVMIFLTGCCLRLYDICISVFYHFV